MADESDEEVVAYGIKTVVHAHTATGRRPSKEDLDRLSEKERVRIQTLFDLLADTGRISNKQKFKQLDGTNLYEFIHRDIRFLCFWDSGGRVVLTNMFRKRGQKTPKREIDRGEEIRKEHQAILKAHERGGAP